MLKWYLIGTYFVENYSTYVDKLRKKCYTRQMYGCLSNSCRIWSILFIWNRYYLCTAYRKMTCSTVWQEYLVWQELDFEFSKAMMTCIWHVRYKVMRVGSDTFIQKILQNYLEVASSNPSRLEAHDGFFRLIIKGIFNLRVLWPYGKKLIS